MKKENIKNLLLPVVALLVLMLVIGDTVALVKVADQLSDVHFQITSLKAAEIGNTAAIVWQIKQQLDSIEGQLGSSNIQGDLRDIQEQLGSMQKQLNTIKGDFIGIQSDLWSIKLRLMY